MTTRDRWARSPVSRGEYARRRRIALIEVLAPDGQCAECLEHKPIGALEIDHVDGVTWNVRAKNAWCRAAKYWREFEAGIPLRALCRSCNGSDGARRRKRS